MSNPEFGQPWSEFSLKLNPHFVSQLAYPPYSDTHCMPDRNIIVIGGSFGAIESLKPLVHSLPADLPAAVFIVVHCRANSPCYLPHILQGWGQLPAVHAFDGAAIEHGRIYVAPPDRHLLVRRGFMSVVLEPKENWTRPAIDPLFRTAALAYGKRVIGVVLSGALDDGTAGLIQVKKQGGVAIVQDPKEARMPSMPQNAINRVAVDHILPVANMACVLNDQLSTYSTEQKPKQEMVSGKVDSHFPFKKCITQTTVELA